MNNNKDKNIEREKNKELGRVRRIIKRQNRKQKTVRIVIIGPAWSGSTRLYNIIQRLYSELTNKIFCCKIKDFTYDNRPWNDTNSWKLIKRNKLNI